MEEKETRTFEERLQAVQETISRIESGKLSLEDSVRQYEEGIGLLNSLDGELKAIERKLTVLQGSGSEAEEVPLEETR